MKIKLENLLVENFKGIKSLSVGFSNNTIIKGMNASGKTSIFDAFSWLLFDKNSQGDTKFQIRPLDVNGNQVDNIIIKVVATLIVDDKIVTIQKTQEQNWVKKRGTDVTEFQGNVNKFEVNTIPRSKAEYDNFISEMVDESLFKMLTNPQAFTSLDWKKQRDIIMKLVTEISDLDVIATEPEKFGTLADDLLAHSVEDLMKREKNSLSILKKDQNDLPIRIDEASKSIVEIDTAELELGKNTLLEQIKEIEEKENDLIVQFAEFEKAGDNILKLKMEISDYSRSANESLIKKKREIQNIIDDFTYKFTQTTTDITKEFTSIDRYKNDIEETERKRSGLLEQYSKISNLEFDENGIVCGMCQQIYPADKQAKIRADFEANKSKQLDAIAIDGTRCKERIEELKNAIVTRETNIASLDAAKSQIKLEIEKNNDLLGQFPTEVDISTDINYLSLNSDLEKMEQAISNMSDGKAYKTELKEKTQLLKIELQKIENELNKAVRNVEQEERISQLKEDQKALGQKVANQERIIFLLEEFTKAKMNMLSEKINSKFKLAKFILFTNQINGGMAETCECEYLGVPYSDLNSGHKIVVGLDIVNTLSEMYFKSCPIWIDNAESLNEFNLPKMDSQMILLSVSDDKNLKVEV